MTNRTPAGRKVVSTFDALMRPIRKEVTGRAPIQYTYDLNGHLVARVLGAGSQARTNRYLYYSSGFVTNVIDPTGQPMMLRYDLAGRVTQGILADTRTTQNDFDANGNLTGLTPPGRPVHRFTYSPVNLLTGYLPPVAVPGTPPTRYGYDLDQQLTTLTRPDGLITQYDYIGGGRNCDRLGIDRDVGDPKVLRLRHAESTEEDPHRKNANGPKAPLEFRNERHSALFCVKRERRPDYRS